MGLGRQSSRPIPFIARGKEDAIWKRPLEFVSAASLALLLLSLLSSLPGLLSHSFSSRSTAGSHSRHWLSSFAVQGFVEIPTTTPGQDVLVAGQGAVPTSGTHAVEGPAWGQGHHGRIEMMKSEDCEPPGTGLAGLAAPAGPGVAGLIRAGSGAACMDSAPQGCPVQLEAGTVLTCPSLCVCLLGVVCVGPAAPGYTWDVSVCVAGCPLYPQRVWPVPKRRTWASTRSWTRPYWS